MPTTPDRLAQFLQAKAAKFPNLRAAVKDQLGTMQYLRNMAMLVYRVNPAAPSPAAPTLPSHRPPPRPAS